MARKRITFILFQRGIVSWGFQIHHFWRYINYPSFFGSHGYDKYNRGVH